MYTCMMYNFLWYMTHGSAVREREKGGEMSGGKIAWPLILTTTTKTTTVLRGFNNMYDVLNISVYDVHMFSSACIPILISPSSNLFFFVGGGVASKIWNFGVLYCCLLLFISIFNRRFVGSYDKKYLKCCFLRFEWTGFSQQSLNDDAHTRYHSEARHLSHNLWILSSMENKVLSSNPFTDIHWPDKSHRPCQRQMTLLNDVAVSAMIPFQQRKQAKQSHSRSKGKILFVFPTMSSVSLYSPPPCRVCKTLGKSQPFFTVFLAQTPLSFLALPTDVRSKETT